MDIASRTTKKRALLCVAALSLIIGSQQVAALQSHAIGGILGGVSNAVNDLTGNLNLQGRALGGSGGNALGNMLGGVTKPVFGLLGSLGNGLAGQGNFVGDTVRQATGALNGIATGATASLIGAASPGSLNLGLGGIGGGMHPALYKREAMGEGAAAAAAAATGHESATNGAIEMGAHYGAAQGAFGGAQAAFGGAAGGFDHAAMLAGGAQMASGFAAGQAAAANSGGFGNAAAMAGVEASSTAAAMAGAEASSTAAAAAANSVNNLGSVMAPVSQVVGRAALAGEAMRNAQAESALAGADMVAHGANNARSASLASNAYRQAKLANARDRVNIAGTIQNSARISDAAIATHDAATRAEDSLLGSEVAVDSASTVLDSDGAYIPPVTSSLLRSLPYGRLGVRNIIPKPLTYPSVLLPDVWLNGVPVNYLNVPLRMLPYTIGSTAATNPLWASGAALANGQIINGQPFVANNGLLLNGMVVDPALAYLSSGALGINALSASSIAPILANGQLEAHDEIAVANMIQMHQLGGAGMSGTYQGYGRLNPVPMITGSVSDGNLQPTTTVGTTYPIGSALVIEPRDSFFQDYVDNASSRQNFDERQQ